MRWFRSVYRFGLLALVVAWYVGELVVLRPHTRPARARWLHRLCRRVVWVLRIHVQVEGIFPEMAGTLISNHLGYADIFVYASIRPCVYCAKNEIRHWPVIGWLTTMAGTVYVERGRGGSALAAREMMGKAIAAGLPVVFFPEGTTTNGESLLPFHSGLLQQAIETGAPIRAARVRYEFETEEGPQVSVRDDVHYWGTVNIVKHLFRFCSFGGVRAKVRFAGEPLRFSSENRKVAALEARAVVEGL